MSGASGTDTVRRALPDLPMAWISRAAILVMTIGFVAGSALNALVGFRDIAILLALGGPLGVVAWAFARAGHHVAAVILVSCAVVGLVGAKLVIGPLGIHDPAAIAFTGVILLNALVLSRRGFLAFLVLTLGAATTAFLVNHLGVFPGGGTNPASWVSLVQFLFITGAIGLIGRLVFEVVFWRLGTARSLTEQDPLTGLLNRTRFLQQVAERVGAGTMGPHESLLVLVDIDGFRRINMVIGHQAADRILAEVAHRAMALQPGALAGRVGDDEIGVLASGVAGDLEREEFLRRLQAALTVEHLGVRVRVTLGAVPVDARVTDAGDLMPAADRALAEAKARRPAPAARA